MYTGHLRGEGMETYEIRRGAAEQRDKPGVRIATMHRVKGLEFEHMLIVSANDAASTAIPRRKGVSLPHFR
jgi:superfamily I DNA/RNA helicase